MQFQIAHCKSGCTRTHSHMYYYFHGRFQSWSYVVFEQERSLSLTFKWHLPIQSAAGSKHKDNSSPKNTTVHSSTLKIDTSLCFQNYLTSGEVFHFRVFRRGLLIVVTYLLAHLSHTRKLNQYNLF